MAETSEQKRLHPMRLIIAIILGIILLVIAITMYRGSHSAPAPAQSTDQMNPNSSRNIPPGGSVNKGGDQSQATTPSPNGTNGTPMSSQ